MPWSETHASKYQTQFLFVNCLMSTMSVQLFQIRSQSTLIEILCIFWVIKQLYQLSSIKKEDYLSQSRCNALLAITAYYKSCIKSESSYWIETQQIMDIKLINKQAKTTQEMDRIKLYRVLIHFLLSIGTTNENIYSNIRQ